MKLLTYLLLSFLTFEAYAQDKPQINPFQFGMNISPDYSFISYPYFYERPKLGFTTGLNASYQLNQRISLETGLHYSNKGCQTETLDIVLFEPDPAAPNQAKYIYNLHFIDIPLKANVYFGSGKSRFFTSVGLTTNFYINETQTNIYTYAARTERETITTNRDLRKVNFSPSLSFGFDYQINAQNHIRFEPTVRCALLPLTNATPGNLPSGQLYNAGLNITYYLGRWKL